MNFFVCGLPRSRTAWLANFLTVDRLCYHEGLDGCHTLEEYKQKLGNNNGDSSTGLMLIDINNIFPDSPKVVIRSDIKNAIDYAYKAYGYYDPQYIEFLHEKLINIDGLHIRFEEIDERLEEIWNYLLDSPFNKERAEILKKLHIEIKDPFAFDIESMKDLWTSLNWQ